MAYRQEIALIGLANAGKSVFLTSFIDQIKYHDPEKFRLTPNVKLGARLSSRFWRQTEEQTALPVIKRFEALGAAKAFREFEQQRFRAAMVQHGKWPEKTTDVYHYRLAFDRSDWRTRTELGFLDFPGERFADVYMIGKEYADWSDALLRQLDTDETSKEIMLGYHELARSKSLSAEDAVEAYKLALAHLLGNYKQLISPSVFMLDRSGGRPRPGLSCGELARERLSGLDASSQFAPLPVEARAQHPVLAKGFEEQFRRYRAEITDPLYKKLKACNQLIILIDVVEILRSGTPVYNDTIDVLEYILGVLKPTKRWGPAKWLPDAWVPKAIERISFVAPKADLVRPEDMTRLEELLRLLVVKQMRNYDISYRCFACAAAESTQPSKERGMLQGVLQYDEEGCFLPPPGPKAPMQSYPVDELPEQWPINTWGEGEFSIPGVYPHMPCRKDDPPRQYGLDHVFDFVMKGREGEGQ